MVAKHRSQGGAFYIVQMRKKRKNSNCRYYKDGICIKFKRVCDIGDSCAGFKNGCLNREELKLLESQENKKTPKKNKSKEISTIVYHYKYNDEEITICLAEPSYKKYANTNYTLMAYDKKVKEYLAKMKSFIFEGRTYKYFYEEKLIEDIYYKGNIKVLEPIAFV